MIENAPVIDGESSVEIVNGRADDRASTRASTPGGMARIKQPRFAITPGKMREALFYRWKLALLAGLILACAGAGLAWLTYKPKYTAAALIRMTSSKERLLGGSEDGGRNRGEEEFQKTEAQMIKSRNVLEPVLKRDDIRTLTTIRSLENPRIWLEKELQGSFLPGTDILRIGLSGEHPEDVALIVNTVKREYLARFDLDAKKQQAERYNSILTVLVAAEGKIKEQRNELRNLAEVHKSGDTQILTLKQKLALEDVGHMNRELAVINTELRKTTALLSVLHAELKAPDEDKLPAELIEEYRDKHPLVQKEQFEIARLESQIKEYGKLVTSSSPRLAQLQDELKAARIQLDKAKLEVQPEIAKAIRGSLQRQRINNLEQAAVKARVLEAQKKDVAEKVKELRDEADKIGRGGFDIEMRRGEIEEAETVLKKLRGEKERLEIEKFNKKEFATELQPADVPTVNQASLLRSVGLLAVAGLALGLLGISYFEARLHRVHQSSQVQQELGIQTLGMLPLLAQKDAQAYGRAQLPEDSLPDIMFADAVNSLCARLLCDDRLSHSSVLMVTSASEGEGKTMLATELAAGLARSGRRTLLLDCDFRNPRCHQQFGLAAGPGLSEVLCGEVELAKALQAVPGSEARILTSGKSNPQVIKALNNGNFAALLARLRLDFDCIIVDSAPTPVVADGLFIGKLADGVLLVVRPKVSKAPAVFAAYEQLAALKIPTLGAVVNANPWRVSGVYYK